MQIQRYSPRFVGYILCLGNLFRNAGKGIIAATATAKYDKQ